MPQRVLLNGYYGFGNLGDDLLMKISCHLIDELFPGAEITICANGDHRHYIPPLTGKTVGLIKDDAKAEFDWIIDGGGGVYFDFTPGSVLHAAVNKFVSLIGAERWSKMLQLYQHAKGNTGLRSKKRAGWGIGVGTYTRTSRRYFADVAKMASYTFLMVRDNASAQHVEEMGIKCPVVVASDIAFLRKYWMPDPFHSPSSAPCIGFILRDWFYGNEQNFKAVKQVAELLEAEGHRIMFFSFDASDKAYADFFSAFEPAIWQPEKLTMNDFFKKIASCNLIITSRAHGAIIPACMGIPLVGLAIEPKLEVVFDWFKDSSKLISYPVHADQLLSTIRLQLERLDHSRNLISEEVNKQESIMEAGIRTFAELLQKCR